VSIRALAVRLTDGVVQVRTKGGVDEVIIESNDRIVTNIFKTLDGNEVKVMEIVNVRKK